MKKQQKKQVNDPENNNNPRQNHRQKHRQKYRHFMSKVPNLKSTESVVDVLVSKKSVQITLDGKSVIDGLFMSKNEMKILKHLMLCPEEYFTRVILVKELINVCGERTIERFISSGKNRGWIEPVKLGYNQNGQLVTDTGEIVTTKKCKLYRLTDKAKIVYFKYGRNC